MGRTAVQDGSDTGAEYAVYTFGVLDMDQINPRMWEKKASHMVRAAAIMQAEELYKTGQYLKVEIKQKYFDKKRNRHVDQTLRTLGLSRRWLLRTVMAVAFAMICGLAAFQATLLQLGG